MYFAWAIKQPDRKQFVDAIVKEVNGHVENWNWELIKRSEVPVGKPIQQSVWAMRWKQNLTSGEIVKHNTPEPTRGHAGIRSKLLQNTCSSGDLVCHPAYDFIQHPIQPSHVSDQFCYGIPTGTH